MTLRLNVAYRVFRAGFVANVTTVASEFDRSIKLCQLHCTIYTRDWMAVKVGRSVSRFTMQVALIETNVLAEEFIYDDCRLLNHVELLDLCQLVLSVKI